MEWMFVDEFVNWAIVVLEVVDLQVGIIIDCMDLWLGKGVVKVCFEGYYIEVQVDGVMGEVLQMAICYFDWLEVLYDGFIVEGLFGIGGGYFKFVYIIIMALVLLIFIIIGFWFWYGLKCLWVVKCY